MTNREFLAKSILDKSNDDVTALWMFVLNFIDVDMVLTFIDKDKFNEVKAGLDKEVSK
jgi:hypothetical protein